MSALPSARTSEPDVGAAFRATVGTDLETDRDIGVDLSAVLGASVGVIAALWAAVGTIRDVGTAVSAVLGAIRDIGAAHRAVLGFGLLSVRSLLSGPPSARTWEPAGTSALASALLSAPVWTSTLGLGLLWLHSGSEVVSTSEPQESSSCNRGSHTDLLHPGPPLLSPGRPPPLSVHSRPWA